MPSADDAAKALLIRLGAGHVVSAALSTVLELGIVERLGGGACSVQRLASDTGTNEAALYRVLRALASVGVFSEETPRHFALTRAGAWLQSRSGTMAGQLRWMTHPLQMRASAEMRHSVQTGGSALETLTGSPLFALLAQDEALSACFHDAMTADTRETMPAVLDSYDLSDVDVLVDVGGGHGEALTLALQRYPHMRGVLFDRADVVAGARRGLAASGVAERCRIEPGDFFAAVPAGGDAYLLRHIVHDWDDAAARVILTRVRAALDGRPRARVLLIESPIAIGNRPDPAKFADLTMLVLVGGRERTVEEYRALCASAGLRLTQAVASRTGAFVLEAVVA
jgi:hypothetical protein